MPNVITSVIYYIFITVYLVSVFRILKRTKDYDVKSVVLKYICVLIPILVAVLFLDILQLFFNSYLGYYAVILSDLRIVVEWLIFFFVILRVLHLRKRPENKKLSVTMFKTVTQQEKNIVADFAATLWNDIISISFEG